MLQRRERKRTNRLRPGNFPHGVEAALSSQPVPYRLYPSRSMTTISPGQCPRCQHPLDDHNGARHCLGCARTHGPCR